MIRKTISELPEVRVLGRSPLRDGTLTLFWTGSGIEFDFDGSAVSLELNADFDQFEPWLSVEVDGTWVARFPVEKGKREVTLFRGMAAGTTHHVRVVKDMQAMSDDPRHLLQLCALHYAGTFVPMQPKAYRIEFMGDSLTSGEGTIGTVGSMDWIPLYFTALNDYARMTADALDADFRIVSQSGWGIVSSWDNNPNHVVPRYYGQVCGLAEGEQNAALGAKDANDFAAWPADAVVINLLANDEVAFHNPPWKDEATGRTFCQRMTDEHTYVPEDLARVKAAVLQTLKEVRAYNPNACIVWVYGMLKIGLDTALKQTMAEYIAQTGDTKAYLCALPELQPDEFGAREHPGVKCHKKAALVLSQFLKSVL